MRVVFVDDDADLRQSMADLLDVMGIECIVLASHEQLVAASERTLASDVAILDINLGLDAPSGIDTYHWLRDHGFRGKIVLLTGHARHHPLVRAAHDIADAEIYEKPIAGERLETLVAGTQT